MATLVLPDPGERVADHDLVRQVGEGGMGVVFEAKSPDGHARAMKLLKPDVAEKNGAVEQFREEARSTASVPHENVVDVYECGVDHGLHYLVMEYVDGPPLDRIVDAGKRILWRTAVRIGIGVAEALKEAHSRGFIHRDIKPGNILLYRDGRARLTDFGIVKDISTLKGYLVTGAKVGTVAYASPEQATGKRLGPATDQYSLGATLYQMICGRPLFTGDSRKLILAKHVKTKPIEPVRVNRDIPKALSNLLMKMVAKKPTERFPTMDALIQRLRLVAEGRVAITTPTRTRHRA